MKKLPLARKKKKKFNPIKVVERKLGRYHPNKKVLGLAWKDNNKIEIDPRQNETDYLDSVIHECLHIVLPKENEKSIIEKTARLATCLWSIGYRRIKE